MTPTTTRVHSPKCFRPWCGVNGRFCIDCSPLQKAREEALATVDLDEDDDDLTGYIPKGGSK